MAQARLAGGACVAAGARCAGPRPGWGAGELGLVCWPAAMWGGPWPTWWGRKEGGTGLQLLQGWAKRKVTAQVKGKAFFFLLKRV